MLQIATIERVCHLCLLDERLAATWFLFGSNLLMRGELARSLDFLRIVQVQLLRMVCISEYSTEHWFNPSKLLDERHPRSFVRPLCHLYGGIGRGSALECLPFGLVLGQGSYVVRSRVDAKHPELRFRALLTEGASEIELGLI
jgi:hypothetical protein